MSKQIEVIYFVNKTFQAPIKVPEYHSVYVFTAWAVDLASKLNDSSVDHSFLDNFDDTLQPHETAV